jgi:RimJ/RimL family protein N-acetyltransferase
MSYEILADKEAAWQFYVERTGSGSRTEHQKGLLLKRLGEPVAAVVYDQFNGSNIFMHVAAVPGKKWMNRHFLHEAFKYPFVTMGCRRITGWVWADNIEAQKFDEHLGFKREAVLKDAAGPGQDVYLYVMFRDECKYA